jgi:dihydroneopterin aldolase
MDSIIIDGLRVFAFHGVNAEEKENGQTFEIDLVAKADLKKACKSDNLDDTVSYAKIIKTVVRVMTEEKDDLIERAAQRVAEEVLKEYEKIESVEVTLKKPDAPIKADFNFTAIKIERTKGDI